MKKNRVFFSVFIERFSLSVILKGSFEFQVTIKSDLCTALYQIPVGGNLKKNKSKKFLPFLFAFYPIYC